MGEAARQDDDSFTFRAHNSFLDEMQRCSKVNQAMFTKVDGAADIATWHKRLGHVCNQYLKTMVDRETVRGMSLTARVSEDCEACHLTNQHHETHAQAIERTKLRPNEVVYADLLSPGRYGKANAKYMLITSMATRS
ncbi:hypothetical protein PybrP1_012540 [[Pythium] brassicae (nom. inval.)]|nr:hypothetical protein PybrP1_012540 [[Pythium] brassicae (nom. inval.)]